MDEHVVFVVVGCRIHGFELLVCVVSQYFFPVGTIDAHYRMAN